MIGSVLEWPRDCFRSATEDWHLAGTTASTGGIFGPGTRVHFENRLWRTTADLTALRPEEWRQLRALFDMARGRFGVLRVPVVQADPQAGGFQTATFDTGRAFASNTGARKLFAVETLGPATVTEAAPAGATLIRVDIATPLVALAAMFSLPGDRVHRVTGRSGGRLRFEPPLRGPVRPGDAVEFRAPWARMHLDLDDASLARMAGRLTAPRAIPLVEALE